LNATFKLLDKKLHPEKGGFMRVKNPIDSHSFCTRPRAPPHGQRRVTAASPETGSNQPVPILFWFYIIWNEMFPYWLNALLSYVCPVMQQHLSLDGFKAKRLSEGCLFGATFTDHFRLFFNRTSVDIVPSSVRSLTTTIYFMVKACKSSF